jgi:hypothetical protein
MKRVLIRTVFVLGVAAGCLLGGQRAAAQELPRAEDILAREAEASGNAAGQKLKTVVMRGTISIQDVKGQFVSYHAAPAKHYLEFTIEGLLKEETGVRGGVAWEKNSITGPRLLQGGERAKALRDASPHAPVKYKQARTVGEETVAGRPAYKVRLTTPEGEEMIAHFDKQSGLLVRQEVTVESPEGKTNLVLFFSDHRRVDGVTYPFTIRVVVGPGEAVMTVDRIEHNVDIPDGRFDLPADVNRLVERQNKQ